MSEKYIVFTTSGRLGNAIFRYLLCAILSVKNNLKYILDEDFNKYIFYKGYDHFGDDIFYSKKSIEEMKTIADNNIDVTCFNTLGFFKNNVLINLESNNYINMNNNEGLYFKNYTLLKDENMNKILNTDISTNILLSNMDDYFQSNVYLQYKNNILEYMENNKNHYIKTAENIKYQIKDIIEDYKESRYDIAIHIRLGDFKDRIDYIDYIYYERLFNSFKLFKNKKICIVTETPKNDNEHEFINKCTNWFIDKKYDITVESNDVITDFNIMKQVETLFCSMSTLSWCAAFLSKKIKVCYMPNYNFKERKYLTFRTPIENTFFYNVKSSLNIKIIVLTLKDYPSRINKITQMVEQFKNKLNIEYEIFYGVNGRNITISDTEDSTIKCLSLSDTEKTYLYDTTIRINKKKMEKGELGCAWSHMNIYNKLIEDPMYDNYLIFEDDAEFVSNSENLNNTLNNLPKDYDVCHIAMSDWFSFILKDKVNDYFYTCEKQYFNRTTAYIISKKGAKLLNKDSIVVPSDDLLSNTFLYNDDFKFYVPPTYLFNEPKNTQSIIKKVK